MAENNLMATRRDVLGKQVKAMRREGMLPAVLYGRKFKPVPVVFDLKETSRMLGRLSGSALVTINLEVQNQKNEVCHRGVWSVLFASKPGN